VTSLGGGTKQRIVEHLQTVLSATAPDLARLMGVSDAAMRQHLEQLEVDGVVRRDTADHPIDARHRGRPALHWTLDRDGPSSIVDVFPTAFPDRHDDLVVDLLSAIESELGPDALERVLARRGERQAANYRESIGRGPLSERVARLARQRDLEGYRAEAVTASDGAMILTEHHCAISDAAKSCGSLCESELTAFRVALGTDVSVERTRHALAGDGRCSYRIAPAD